MIFSAGRLAQICKGEGAAASPLEIITLAAELEQLRAQFQPKAAQFPPDRQVVETNLGPAGRIDGQWFKWWPEVGQFARIAMKDKILWWYDEGNHLRYTDANTAAASQGQTILQA